MKAQLFGLSQFGRILAAMLLACLLTCWPLPVRADSPPPGLKISGDLQTLLQTAKAGDMLTVIVRLQDQTSLAALTLPAHANRTARLNHVINQLQRKAAGGQQAVLRELRQRQAEGWVSQITPLWIFNGLAVTATPDIIFQLAARPDVQQITPNRTIEGPPAPAKSGVGAFSDSQINLQIINVPALWAMGYRGQDIIVANLDTGVSFNSYFHPALWARWRGGNNSWFDPYGEHPTTPTDVNGHGTRTMGVMIGGEHNGTAFGVAPEAKWIAAKIFKDNNSGTALGIHQAFQWILDPDGNPNTPDAPHVVNNSWTWFQGCNLEFQADLQALRAAGILPIFAAGNSALTSHSPANNPAAFAVGATDNNDLIWTDSSRGPSACDGTIFPEVVAPGVDIHTTSLYGTYYDATGTSLAAPQVAGALALLLNVNPNMTAAQQEAILLTSIEDKGAVGPDNTYGYGRVNFLTGYQAMLSRVYLPMILR